MITADLSSLKKDRVLFVDDESLVLLSLRRFFRQNNIEVDVETDCFRAVQLIRENKYKVIISDFRMPSMNGAEFLEVAKEISPESVRLVLSAHINQEALADIINKSEVYKFVSKPWRDLDLLSIVKDSIIKYDRENELDVELDNLDSLKFPKEVIALEISKDSALESDNFFQDILPRLNRNDDDFKISIDSLRSEQHRYLNYIINLASPRIGLHCKRVSQLVFYFAQSLNLPPGNVKNLYYAGLYHDIGKLFQYVAQADHSELGVNLISQFEELKEAAKIIKDHHVEADSEAGKKMSIESKILMIVDYFDKAVSKEYEKDLGEKAKTLSEILGEMVNQKGLVFDAELIEKFKELVLTNFKLESFVNESKIHLTELVEGMILSRPLFNVDGKILLNSEYRITKEVIVRIFKHNQVVAVKSPLFVYAKAPEKVFNFEELILKKIRVDIQ